MNENRPRPAIAAGQTTSPQAKLATTQGTGSDGNRSFTSSLGASKTFPMTREVYTTNMNIGLPTVKQKNMSEGLLRMLERPRTAGKLKQEAQHESMASVTFSTRPGTAASVRRSSSHDPRLSSSTNLVSPLFSAYGISPKHAIPSFAPTQFLQRPISAQRAILRPPSASSMSSFASSSQRLQPASSSPSKNRSGVYCDAKAQDHVGVGAAKLVELTQKLVMKRMQSSLEDVDNAQWKSSDATFLVDLPIPSTSSSAGSTPIAPQPWMRLHADTEEIIVQLEWDGSAPAVHDSTRAALIQTLGEPASVAKLHALCGGPRSVPDLDLSVIMLDDKLAVMDVVYYNNLCSRDCSLLHSGDNTLSGIRRESAVVTLSKVSPGVHAIAFSVNLHGTVPPSSQQQRAVSTEGRPSSSLAPKSEQPASNSAALDAISASDVLWVPENCRLRVLSSVHSFALASYNISFVASDDVWNPKLTRRPMSGGGRLRTLSKSSSLDNMVDCDADVQTVEDNDGDAAWDELDDKNQSSVSGQNARRAGRFLGSSLRRSIHETRMSSMEAPRSEEDAGVHKVDSSRDLVQQVALAANQAEATTVQYIDWISFVDTCDASGNLHIQREVCLTAFRDASAALSDSGSSKEEKEEDASISTRPLPLSLFASMLQTTLLPLVRQSEYKLPSPSTLRRGMEAMCACLGCDSRQPLNEQVIDIARVQRGANVFCLHRGNQSSAFASSIAAENRTAGKHSFSVERSWFLQTLGSVTLAVNLVQNLSSMRELLVMSGVFIPVIVAVEYCTADRPSLSLRGRSTDFSDRYDALKARVERSLPFVKVEANPTWLLPGGPRISAFEVFFQDPSNMNCICVHSKSESKCWPNAAEVVAKLQRLMQAREKVYKLPVDLCPVRLMCKSSFKQMPPLDGVPVHIHRIGDENEISDIISMAGAPASQLHSLDSLQGEGVSQFVTQDAATLCFSGRSASDGMFSTRLTAGVFLATVGGDSMVPGHVLLFVRTLHKETITATVIVKPQLFRLSGRVVDGSSGNPITHGSISLRNCGTDGEVIVFQLVSPNHSDACIKTPVPQLAFSPALQPDTFSDSSGSRASEQLLSSGHQESSHASSGESIPPQGQSMSATVGTAARSSTGDGVLSPRAPHVADCADDSVSSTIFAVVNGSADDLNRNDGRSSPSITRSEKIKQSAGLFEIMVPQGDYTLTVNIHGYSAGGVYKVSIRRGALHMGVICVNPDTDLLLLNNLRDLRAKKCFSMQGILSANMPLVSAVLDQANAAEAATKAAAVENAAFKKRVLRSKVSRCSESNPASFVSSYQLSVPLVLLRSAGVVADKAGKISIRHRSHRFASLVLPPSSCKPGFDAPAADKLPVCKNKAAHIARHILCGASRDFCEKFCTIDSRALSDDKDLHRESFTLVIQAGDSTFENGGTFLKVASGQRFAAIAGLPVAFTLHMNDRCMNPCLSSLDAQDVSCTARLGSTNLAVQVFETCDLGLGRYVISFLPPMEHPGAYSVSCTVKNIHVEGSPFTVTVVPYEPAVTFGSRLTLQPIHSCLPWPHCCPPDEAAPETPTVIVTKDSPALVARGWYAPFELYNEETARWVGSGTTVGEVDVVFVIEICLENQRLVEAISCSLQHPTNRTSRHCSDTLMAGLLQLDLCTSLNVGLVLYTFSPPSSDAFDPVQVHGPCSSLDAAAMLQSALSSESFVGRSLEIEGNRNALSSTTTNVALALESLASFSWRPLAARVAIIFPRNAPPGIDIHHIPDSASSAGSLSWWQSCEKLRSMSVELHAIRMLSSYPYGPVSSCAFVQAGYPFSVLKGKDFDSLDARQQASFDEVTQALKTWHIACNNPKLSSAVSDSVRRLAITAHAAYSAAVDACFTVQTQQTGGVFLKVADIPSALASLPQLIAQSLDMRLFTEALINEAVVHREQLLLVPNVADRKHLILQLLQRNNITLRKIFFARDKQGKAALRPSLATMEALEIALSHLKGEYRMLLLDEAPMLNVILLSASIASKHSCNLTLLQKLALAHRRGSAFALAVELIELGLL